MNAIYPKFKEAILSGTSNALLLTNDVNVMLIDTDVYTYDPTHEFRSDVSGIISTSVIPIRNKTVTNGLFSGDQVLFSDVTGTSGEAVIIYIVGTTDNDSRLVAFFDNSTGLPLTPNGSDITAFWENGIFQL